MPRKRSSILLAAILVASACTCVIETLVDGKWQKISEGTNVGHKRILRFESPVAAKKIRVRITDAYATPLLTRFELY